MIFTTPIKIFINSQSEPILFESSEELLTWVEKQSTEWNDFSVQVRPASDGIQNASAYIVQNATHWLNHASSISNYSTTDDEVSIRSMESSIQSLMQQGQMIWTGDILASKALAIAESDQMSAVWIYLLATGLSGQILQSYGTPINWSNYGKSLLFLSDPKTSASFHSKQSTAIRSIEKTINAAKTELDAFKTTAIEAKANFDLISKTSIDDFSTIKDIVADEARSQRKSFDDEWIKLRSAYDSQLKLSAPREYWQQKLVSHKKSSDDWRNAFFLMIALASLILVLALNAFTLEWIKIPKNMAGFVWIFPAVVIGVPSFISLWLLRFFGRQWSEHLGRTEDARERVVMIETFLALSRDTDSPGAITDPAQLALVLSSIFRPASNGANDDSPPAGFFEAILTNLTKTSSHK